MKSSSCAFFLIFAFIIASSVKANEFVMDTRGRNIVNGGAYYIMEVTETWAGGGGLEVYKIGNETCPLSVVKTSFEMERGLPWRITTSSLLKIPFISTKASVDLFLVEGEVPRCAPKPSKWCIVEGEDGIKSVKISGYENTLEGWFKIQKVDVEDSNAYKIVFRPTNGDSCGDLGISSYNRLVITNDSPFVVEFIEAQSFRM